jgi:hypothetical protein
MAGSGVKVVGPKWHSGDSIAIPQSGHAEPFFMLRLARNHLSRLGDHRGTVKRRFGPLNVKTGPERFKNQNRKWSDLLPTYLAYSVGSSLKHW